MRISLVHLLLVAVLTACACDRKPSTPPAKTTASGSPDEVASARPSATGPLSEEEFKAMHQLRTDAPPPLTGAMIDLAGSRAYLSLPKDASGPRPGIVVIHEWWGLNDHIKHWTDRLAGLGWAALAVDLYGGKVATNPDDAMSYMKGLDEAGSAQVMSAALEFLASDPRIKATRRAVIGWCFGGGWSLKTALTHPELDAAILYYGRLESDPARLAAIKAEVLGIFGNRDQGIPPADVDAFDAGLTKAGVRHAIVRYDADHAFANPSNPKYDQKAAGDAWEHVKALLGRTAK